MDGDEQFIFESNYNPYLCKQKDRIYKTAIIIIKQEQINGKEGENKISPFPQNFLANACNVIMKAYNNGKQTNFHSPLL